MWESWDLTPQKTWRHIRRHKTGMSTPYIHRERKKLHAAHSGNSREETPSLPPSFLLLLQASEHEIEREVYVEWGRGSRGRHISVSPIPNMGGKTVKLRILGFSAQFFSPASYHSSELTYLLLLRRRRRRRRWLRVIGRIPFLPFPLLMFLVFGKTKSACRTDGRRRLITRSSFRNAKLFDKSWKVFFRAGKSWGKAKQAT